MKSHLQQTPRPARRLLIFWCSAMLPSAAAIAQDNHFYDDPDQPVGLEAKAMLEDVAEPAVPLYFRDALLGSFQGIEAYDLVPGTDDFPLTFVSIISNMYIRPTYQRLVQLPYRSASFGTSVVATASFRTSDGILHLVPSISEAEAVTGPPDRVSVMVRAVFSAGIEIQSTSTFPDPRVGATISRLTIELTSTQDVALHSGLLGSDAFRLVTLSSMYANAAAYDANLLRYVGAGGTVQRLALSQVPSRPQHLFPSARELGSWFEAVKQPGSSWYEDSPSIRIRILSHEGTGRLGLQGFLDASTATDSDSLSCWLEWIDAPAIIPANTHVKVVLEITAFTSPADFDGDGHVGTDDFSSFLECLTGPALPLANPECSAPFAKHDLDGDGDVDQEDFGVFQRCYSGPSGGADPICGG